MSTMVSGFMATGLIALAVVYALINRFSRPPLSKIRGPKSSSFFVGNLLELFQRPAGQTELEWKSLYGNVVRFKSILGEDQLLIADPEALQKIFNTSSYHYPKQPHLRVISRMLHGKGIFWADGNDHKRQRKVLLPGFGGPESRAFLSIFRGCAESMCAKWMEIIGNSSDEKVVLDTSAWLSRGTLDAIAEAFGVQFHAIESDDHPLVKTYNNLLYDISGCPSAQEIFLQAVSKYVPTWILEWTTDHGSNPRLERAREMKKVATEVAKEMLREKVETLSAGEGGRDVFSSLVKANINTEAKNKLTEDEILSVIRSILFAGHETTSNSLGWILWELARHPEMQTELRGEIRRTEAAVWARGDAQITMADFDAMPYTTAVIKEGLRYHPVVPYVRRMAENDDVIPLSRPITLESGEAISEIVIPKGTRLVASIAAYNRDKDLWGEDAHEFNPDRWLEGVAGEKKAVSVGVYSNLMTFISGARACLGWRFAVIEMQAFLIEIFGRFELTITEKSEKVFRGPSFVMFPMVEGQQEQGCQLPLAVSVAPREDDV